MRRTREVATVDERILGRASGVERDLEPSPSGLLQQASQGGLLGRSLCGTGPDCQARPPSYGLRIAQLTRQSRQPRSALTREPTAIG
jgi:hypothetical protein